jgi:hypothetical protein
MDGIQYEYRLTKQRIGYPQLKPIDESKGYPFTYRSLYGYDNKVSKIIDSKGNTRDLKGVPVYSDELIIDCDTDDDSRSVELILGTLDIGYIKYTTGNRGHHFHVPHDPLYGTNTIWSQLSWLHENGLYKYSDKSIYREGGQIRLPGAIHEKTGKTKEVIFDNTSIDNLVVIPESIAPPPVSRGITNSNPNENSRYEYHRNLLYSRTEGGRHGHMFILFKRGIEAGIDIESIYDDIRWWNDTMAHPPHSSFDLERKLRGFRE